MSEIFFVANSAWYLKNFRTSTLFYFSQKGKVTCVHPLHKNESNLDLPFSSRFFYLNASSQNFVKEFISLVSLWFLFFRFRPDLAFVFNPKTNLYSLISCWLLRIPCVPNVSGVGVASQLRGVTGKLYRFLVGYFYFRSPYVFFQNYDDYRAFVEAGWVKPDRSEVLPGSGVNLSIFKPAENKNKKIRFLMAARLIKQKGVVEYLEAARKIVALSGVECEFVLAGVKDTSSRAVDPQLLSALDLEESIHFVGHVEDMPSLLETVDCVVLPSYYPEGVPRSLIEAAASGKVIITTDTPGCREVVIEGKNGYLVEPQSVDQLAEAMINVLELPVEKRLEMQRASRALAEEKFDEQIVIRRYLEVAEKITGHPFTQPTSTNTNSKNKSKTKSKTPSSV